MSLLPPSIAPKITATSAAANLYGTAVVLTEPPAAFLSFQQHPPSLPPSQNRHSALSPLLPAMQFSGNNAIGAHFSHFMHDQLQQLLDAEPSS